MIPFLKGTCTWRKCRCEGGRPAFAEEHRDDVSAVETRNATWFSQERIFFNAKYANLQTPARRCKCDANKFEKIGRICLFAAHVFAFQNGWFGKPS